MKYILGFLFLASVGVYAQNQSIRQQFAPDRRTEWYEVTLRNGVAKGLTTSPQAKKALWDSLATTGQSWIDSVRVLPDHVVGEKKTGIVHVSVANLRALPQESSELSSQVLMGSKVRILDQVGNWLLVQSPDRYIGWMDPLSVIRWDDQEVNDLEEESTGIFTSAYGFIYEKPNTSSQPLRDVCWGNIIRTTGKRKGEFHQVKLWDGQLGWCSSIDDYKTWQESRKPTEENLKKQAFLMMGIPYLWGGTSWKGVDCSGYTRMIYASVGTLLPRDASQQVREGRLVTDRPEFDSLKIGDLLFFGRILPNGQERVTHVAMWIGNQEFIHASGYVRVGSMDPNSPYFDAFNRGRFLRAHRYLGEVPKSN